MGEIRFFNVQGHLTSPKVKAISQYTIRKVLSQTTFEPSFITLACIVFEILSMFKVLRWTDTQKVTSGFVMSHLVCQLCCLGFSQGVC